MTGREPAWDGEWVHKAVEQHEEGLALYAARLLGDPDRAQDVVQQTFLQLCRQDRTRIDDHLAPWLYTVCRNEALTLLRKEKRSHPTGKPEEDAQKSGDPSPPEALEATEDREGILALLGTLPGDQQEAIRLKYQQGLRYREISRVMGISETNVGVLLHRGLKKLAEELEEKDGR